MDPRSKVLQKPIYQAISKVWGAGSSFINTVLVISNPTTYLIQCNDSLDFAHPRVQNRILLKMRQNTFSRL